MIMSEKLPIHLTKKYRNEEQSKIEALTQENESLKKATEHMLEDDLRIIKSLESEIKELREALEWLFKNYDPDDFLEERNGDYRLLIGINNYFGSTPLEAIQKARSSQKDSTL